MGNGGALEDDDALSQRQHAGKGLSQPQVLHTCIHGYRRVGSALRRVNMSIENHKFQHTPQRGLLFLRGQGETKWVPHADVPWLRETPAGLEVDLEDALRESERQNRPGLLLLGHPGGGKSHALEHLAALCRDGQGTRLGLAPELRPATIDLDRWRPEAGPMDSWLEEQVHRESTQLILVDSIDRLSLNDRRLAAHWLRRMAAETPDRRLVVTCRFDSYEPDIELGNDFLEVQLCSPSAATSAKLDAPEADSNTIEDDCQEFPPGTMRARRGGYVLTAIPGGFFQMGSPADEPERWGDEGPRHRVDIAPFYLGTQPVTHGEFARFLADQPTEPEPDSWRDPRFNGDAQPVVGVGWDQARRYADWAGLRLPTEAEWEYACRAATSGARYGDLDAIAWHAGNSGGKLHPTGTRAANPWGLFDMLGNIWEWMEDDHHPGYEGAPDSGQCMDR